MSIGHTAANPGAEMRTWLPAYAINHPCHGFRHAWTGFRFDERREVIKKKVYRLWREEVLHDMRKRGGVFAMAPIEVSAPNVLWASDFGSTSPSTATPSRSPR
jgi:hypothetical protein